MLINLVRLALSSKYIKNISTSGKLSPEVMNGIATERRDGPDNNKHAMRSWHGGRPVWWGLRFHPGKANNPL
jgi:hypothetical protein